MPFSMEGGRSLDAIVTTFVLGLLGSLGHCVGMCGPVTILLTRPVRAREGDLPVWPWLASLHLGRLITYSVLGAIVALVGHGLGRLASFLSACVSGTTITLTPRPDDVVAGFRYIQGGLALVVAALLLYMALAAAGRVPPVEVMLTTATQRWGRTVREMTALATGNRPWRPLSLGLVWGLLPCGLVYTALLVAATAAQPWQGAAVMAAFGTGTLPAMAGAGWLSAQGRLSLRQSARYLAAAVIFLAGVQMMLRGLAVWGVVGHTRVVGIMLW